MSAYETLDLDQAIAKMSSVLDDKVAPAPTDDLLFPDLSHTSTTPSESLFPPGVLPNAELERFVTSDTSASLEPKRYTHAEFEAEQTKAQQLDLLTLLDAEVTEYLFHGHNREQLIQSVSKVSSQITASLLDKNPQASTDAAEFYNLIDTGLTMARDRQDEAMSHS